MPSNVRKSHFLLAAALGASAACTAPGAGAAETEAPVLMRPMQVVSIEAGAKRIVGSFIAVDGECNLSATISVVDRLESDATLENSVAVQATLAPGRASRIDTGAGDLLQFFCRSGAQTMTATKVNETITPRSVEPLAPSPRLSLDLVAATGL